MPTIDETRRIRGGFIVVFKSNQGFAGGSQFFTKSVTERIGGGTGLKHRQVQIHIRCKKLHKSNPSFEYNALRDEITYSVEQSAV